MACRKSDKIFLLYISSNSHDTNRLDWDDHERASSFRMGRARKSKGSNSIFTVTSGIFIGSIAIIDKSKMRGVHSNG